MPANAPEQEKNSVDGAIKLHSFTLKECEEFFEEKHLDMSRYDIAQSYMIIGGIPYYMGYFKKGLGLVQNIDRLFLAENARLVDEFDRLFNSAWIRQDDGEEGVQIDLIIKRSDNAVNMCEMKYYSDDFSVKDSYYRTILRRLELLRNVLPAKMSIQSTLITTFGLVKGKY